MPKIVEEDIQINGFGIAINLIDLDRVDQLVRQLLLAGKLDLSRDAVIQTDKDHFDEMAVRFTCDALTAACVCDTIRNHDRRAGDYPTRVYVRKAVAWVKVAGNEHLSIVVGDKVLLNPKVFGDEVVTIRESRPMPPKPMRWGIK